MKAEENTSPLPGAPGGVPQHEHLLQAIWDHSLDALLLTAPDGRIFAANPAACSLFGHTEAEICRLGRAGLLDLSDPLLAESLAERERTGQVRQELMFIRADGSRFSGEVTSAVFTVQGGQARTSVIIRDVTERQRAAELLREQALFPLHNPGPVLRVDARGVITMVNPAASAVGLGVGARFQDRFPATRDLGLPGCIDGGKPCIFEAELGAQFFQFTITGDRASGQALIYGTDITERLRAEEELREREVQYRSIFENSIMGISQALPDGRLIHVNQAYAEMYGYATPAEMLAEVPKVGQGLYANPDERQAVHRILSEKGSLEPREFTLVRRDGSRFVALVSAREIRDAAGQLLFYQAEHVDITARKQAETALRESEAQYHNLFEYMFSGFVLMEVLFDAAGQPVDHRLLQANAEFDRMTGLKRSEEIGRTSATLGFKWPAEVSQEFYRVALGGEPLHGERFNKSLQRYYDRRVFSPRKGQFAMVFTDITARKAAEEALQRSERRFATIFRASPSAIGISRLADGIFLDINDAFVQLYGYPRSEVIGHTSAELRLWQSSNRAEVLRDVITKQSCQVVELQGRRKDGEIRDLLAAVETIELAGEPCIVGILTDITDRKRAEATLRQSEQKFRAVFDLAPVGISLLNAEHQISDLNPALEKIMQMTKADLLADRQRFRRFVRSDGTPMRREEWPSESAYREQRAVQDVELGTITEEGRKIWMKISAAPLDPDSGSIVVITQDITASKEAESALRENEQRLRVGLALANIAVFNQDLELRYTWIYQPQLGYAAPEVIGKTDFDLMPPAAAQQAMAAKREALTTGCRVRHEIAIEQPDGTKIFALIVEPLRNAAGLVTGITGASLDITDREQSAAALRQSEERMYLVLEATRDGIWDWDLRTDRSYLSPRYYELTGYQPGEFVPDLAFFKRIVHPEDFPLVLEKMSAHLQGLTDQSAFDYRLVTKSGVIRWVFGRGRVVERDTTGAPLRMVGTVTDITDRKLVEADLAASQTALRALAARLQSAREEERQRIARRVHDDLGHAFTDLKLDLAWLDRRLAERKLTRRAAARQKIAAMIQRVEADLNTTRTLSADLRPAVLDSLGLVAALEWAAQQFERRLHIPCTLELPADFPPLATDRAAALFRAFEEILSNVARHAGATRVRVRLAAAAGQVVMEVDDNGRGITAQERDDSGAIGLLGLRERALEFGGTVEISGAPGKGTRVRVSIPSGTS